MQMLDAAINLKDNFSGTLEKVEKTAGNFQRTIQNTGKDVWRAGKDLEKTGKSLIKNVTAPIAGVGIASGKMAIDFNEGMASIGTLIPGQVERLEELKSATQDVAIATGKSTGDISDGVYSVISAYGDAEDTMEKVELNAKAATAGLAETSDALNLSSAIMKGYGDTSAEANEHVLDLAFTTLRLGQTTFPDLASSMGKVVPTSNELGVSQEELFAIFATGTGVTGNASEVSTQYQGVLKSLMSPTKDVSKLMAEMGYENGQAMIAGEGLAGSVGAIVDKAKETGQPLQSYIGSIQGQVLALALAGEQSDVYDEKLHELMESTGALDTAFAEQTEGINATGFSFQQSMIKMQVAGQKLGDALAPMIESIAEKFSKFGDYLNNLSSEQLDTIIKFAKMAAVMGPIILLIGKLTLGTSKMLFLFGDTAEKINKFGGVLKLLKSPMMLVVGAMTALVLAGILVYKNWDKIKPVIDRVREAFNEFVENNQDKIDWIKEKFGELATTIKEKMSEAWEVFQIAKEKVSEFAEYISGPIETIKEFFVSLGETIWEKIQGLAELFEPLKESFGELFTSLGDIFEIFKEDLSRLFTEVGALFELVIPYLLPIMAFIGGVFVGSLVVQFMTLFNAVVAAIEGIAGVLDGLIQIMTGVIDFVVGVFTGDWDRAWNGVKTIFDGIVQVITSIWETFVGFVTAPVDAIVDILDGVFHEKVQGIKDAWESVKKFLKNPIKGTVNAVKKGAGWAKDKIGNNYQGTDNWRGGPTWVHEKGPEIIDLPQGTRIYPHDKSLEMARKQGIESARQNITNIPKVKQVTQQIKQKLSLANIPKIQDATQWIKQTIVPERRLDQSSAVPQPTRHTIIPIDYGRDERVVKSSTNEYKTISIAKLAETIVVREDADIDKIANTIVSKITDTGINMA